MSRLLSIVVPTRNRQKIVINVIKSILKINSNDFELVIQDNSDNNDLMIELTNLIDDRLVYNYEPETITFSENFQRGIELCSGQYVCFIGDDDGVNPEIVNLAHELNRLDIDSVSFKNSVSYFWPGIPGLTNERNGTLQIGDIKCTFDKYNVDEEFDKLLRNGGQEYLKFGLPKLYHGIIKKEIIDTITKTYGKCFDSLSPDIFSTVLLSEFIKITYVTDYPYTIAGSCSRSASAASMTKKHEGKLEDAPHFRGFVGYSWSDFVPKFYSVETIWAESLVFALKKIKNENLLEKFSQNKMMQHCLDNHPSYKKIIIDSAKANDIRLSIYSIYLSRLVKRTRKNINRIVIRLEIIFNIRSYFKDSSIPDMVGATSVLEENLYSKKISHSRVFN
ncbi:MAG: hypothetical protein PWR27_1134 [Petroclostridium sp.]|nr:hypothetical protein [Petroclostridium sp.]